MVPCMAANAVAWCKVALSRALASQDSVLMLYQACVACAESFTQHDLFLLQGRASNRIDSYTFELVWCTGATNRIDSITHLAYCWTGHPPPRRPLHQRQTTASCQQTATCTATTATPRTSHKLPAWSRCQSWTCRRCSMCWTLLMNGLCRLSSVPSKLKRLHR